MKTSEVRDKYIKFFLKRGHIQIPPAPLVLVDDPTTLFTSSGMQPLVPYLSGQIHPEGKRLVDSQPSIRTQDIEEVGDNRHTTFFEMLGNWSLGDYFKSEQLSWFYEFLTKEIGLDPTRLWVSVFEGDKQVPRDDESVAIWKKLGIPERRIGFYDAKKNWWSRNGTPDQMPIGDIGGPDSEVFFDFGDWRKTHENSPYAKDKCHMNCDCGRFLEIGNSVFIQYKKISEDKLEELPQKNVDFGGGLERIVAASNDDPDVFQGDGFMPIIEKIQEISGITYIDKMVDYRILADHLRASVFLIANGVEPSNKMQGYVLRRLLRRSVAKLRKVQAAEVFVSYEKNDYYESIFSDVVSVVLGMYGNFLVDADAEKITNVIEDEVRRFAKTLNEGIKQIEKAEPFDLYQTYGLPVEIIEELYKERNLKLQKEKLEKEIQKHKTVSRTSSKGVFKGGLVDTSEEVVRLHTATHLLQASLRKVLGEGVEQKGQNITHGRSRFDFSHKDKLTDKELEQVENLINQKIDEDIPVTNVMLSRSEAEESGALHFFGEKYGGQVSVYYIGQDLESAFSKEFCGGPHVTSTGAIGHVKIVKQEKIGSGVMRIYVERDDGSK